MSVLCCYTRDFLIGIIHRHHPELAGKPVAVLEGDEGICAVSTQARRCGVYPQMPMREAQVRCPDLVIHPLEFQTVAGEQHAFVDIMTRTGLPVETPGLGVAYIDLRQIAVTSQKVKAVCADVGRQLRCAVGADIPPSLGWDSGKFTARAAAVCVKPGHMRLVDKADESHFLAPLSIDLLPLPPSAIQQLGWLGIKTLGQFAKLSKTAVAQRFGAAGVLAWRLAQGRDDRAVRPTVGQLSEPMIIDFDVPVAVYEPVVHEVMAALTTQLNKLKKRLEGIRRLALELRFINRTTKSLDCTFLEPVGDIDRLQRIVAHKLQTTSWHAELTGVCVTIAETGELMPQQLMLFAGEMGIGEDDPLLLEGIAQKLKQYAGILYRGELVEATHAVVERRSQLRTLA